MAERLTGTRSRWAGMCRFVTTSTIRKMDHEVSTSRDRHEMARASSTLSPSSKWAFTIPTWSAVDPLSTRGSTRHRRSLPRGLPSPVTCCASIIMVEIDSRFDRETIPGNRRLDIERYIAPVRPTVINLNLTPLIDSHLIDAYVICNPMRAKLDLLRLSPDSTPVIAPDSMASLPRIRVTATWSKSSTRSLGSTGLLLSVPSHRRRIQFEHRLSTLRHTRESPHRHSSALAILSLSRQATRRPRRQACPRSRVGAVPACDG